MAKKECIRKEALGKIPKDKLKPCSAKIEVIYPFTAFGGEEDKRLVLPCCLLAPHAGYKHYNPRLLLTMGGDRITQDARGKDITSSWAAGVERSA